MKTDAPSKLVVAMSLIKPKSLDKPVHAETCVNALKNLFDLTLAIFFKIQ